MYDNTDDDNLDGNDDCTEEEDELLDWQLPSCYMKKRHKEKIEGSNRLPQTWKIKEKMKTVSVALVLCLNVGVDPPDIVKTNPCARMECWKDPLSLNPEKALNAIANNLQQQYERWQPRARYRHNLDPTVDDVKKLCTSLRRNAKEERVLFHYNGHGVPRPTHNGEIWVFNKQYTQYIPLSLYDLQTWMGSPSIYVYDCSNGGLIVNFFNQFARQREVEYESALSQGSALPPIPPVRNCIQLAACGADELLPMLPDLPADLFTSCLTTPMKVALRWFVSQRSGNLIPYITLNLIEKIPGQLNDRRTPLGELNWIFTAVTDTIAWNILPRELFQKLFRQDLLVASLFRNFLLAERVMRSYNCTPVTCPKLPSTYQHPMWFAWDFAVDQCLSQLPLIIKDESKYKNSTFFTEQLTAFQVWLAMGNASRQPPEQLPIVLQVLLSQVHRLRALDLLGRFLDLGPWAVSLALSVGIFPYVLKLLQSTAKELRPLMVFIWAKILAVDSSCQADLVKDNGHKYFLSVLVDPYIPAEHRTTGSFVLARIIHDYPAGQEVCLKGNMISICLEQLTDQHPLFRQWLALCLGLIWSNCDAARWCGIRDSAQDKLSKLLTDPLSEVRAAAVFALGRLIANTGDRSDHANMIDHGVATTLASTVANDGSPLVRKELVVAFYGMIVQFENAFGVVAVQFLEEDRKKEVYGSSPSRDPETKKGWILVSQGNESAFMTSTDSGTLKKHSSSQQIQQGQQILMGSKSSSSVHSEVFGSNDSGENIWLRPSSHRLSTSSSYSLRETVYTRVWKAMLNLSVDPYHEVQEMAKKVVNIISVKAAIASSPSSSGFSSMPSSPNTKDERGFHKSMSTTTLRSSRSSVHQISTAERPKIAPSVSTNALNQLPSTAGVYKPHSVEFSTKRKMFDKGPDVPQTPDDDSSESDEEESLNKQPILVRTKFYEWCCNYFAQSVMKPPDDLDPSSPQRIEREWRFLRNSKVRQQSARELKKNALTQLEEEIFFKKNSHQPFVLKFHPYLPHFAVSDRAGVSIWNYEAGLKVNHFNNGNPKSSRITSMDILNSHDISLLLTGTDDGAVKVWRNYYDNDEGRVSLVTAWTALSGMIPSYKRSTHGSGLVTHWEQQSGMLLASGDVRIVRVWDAHREMKIQDIPTGADSCVTSMACDSVSGSLLVAGLGDGTVRIYDRRLPPDDCRVMTLREHNGCVLKVFLSKRVEGNILSGSMDGDIKFWESRMTSSIRTISSAVAMTSLDFHPQTDFIACGTANQGIKLMNSDGNLLNHIKYHNGFIGQRLGSLNCVTFHPYWPYLAACSMDSFLSIYAPQKAISSKLEDLGI